MKKLLLSVLRDKNIDIKLFRETSDKLASILASDVGEILEKNKIEIDTPTGKSFKLKFKNDIVIVPILRAAFSLLPEFLNFFEYAMVGFLGLRRDEKTAIANEYYRKLPTIKKTDDILLLDPMIATGGSGLKAIQILKELGVREEKIIFVSVICSKDGVSRIKKNYPNIKFIYVEQDEILNKDKFIVPGLGDFGDRFFGTL